MGYKRPGDAFRRSVSGARGLPFRVVREALVKAYTIEPMASADMGAAVDWAAAEGWNPGL
jgi:hypothetical protein